MKPATIDILTRRLYNRFGVLKTLLLLSVIVIVFFNVVSSLLNYPLLHSPLYDFYSFAFTSNISSSSVPSSEPNKYARSSFNTSVYARSSFNTSVPLSDLNSSSSSSQTSIHSPPQPSPPPPPSISFSPPPPPPPPILKPSPPPPPPPSPPPPSPPPPPPPPSSPPPPSPPPPSSPPPPPSPPPPSPPPRRNPTSKPVPKDCDLSRGEWIQDSQSPYYTNTTCYTIQEHQNCMKFGRPDTDYLKWRWKPDSCELPLFDPAQFLEFMRNKSMAFIGDSLARNQMQSLMCLLSRVSFFRSLRGFLMFILVH